jgi:hypothetical protein
MRVFVVAEINRDDPSEVWIIDLDKCPADHPYTKAILKAAKSAFKGESIDTDDSLSYGTTLDYDTIKASLPAHVEDAVKLFIED